MSFLPIAFAAVALLKPAPVGQPKPDPIAKVVGTWVRDSATGPDDAKIGPGQAVILSRAGNAMRLVEKASLDAKPVGPPLDCAPEDAATAAGAPRGCTLTFEPGSLGYSVYTVKDGKRIEAERGKLTVTGGGKYLIDLFERKDPNGPTTRHRHVYRKVG